MHPLRYASRRALVCGGIGLVAGVAGAGVTGAAQAGREGEKELGAVEDLMREHGVLRRALCVYTECAGKLRGGAGFDPKLVERAAQLFRRFGEGYHEMVLEELHVFPQVKQADSVGAGLIDTLMAQHKRGREITQYIIQVTGKGAIGTGDAEPLARAFDSFVWMYRNHAAREDTVVFPAWKKTLSEQQLRETAERFEDIERQQFGHDGFADAVTQMAGVEEALGLSDLARFTAPSPPAA